MFWYSKDFNFYNFQIKSTELNELQPFVFLGAFVPLTITENIVVNGVLASYYPSSNHDVAHISMAPLHWFPDLTQLIFGDDNGMQTYVSILNDLGRWVSPYVLQEWNKIFTGQSYYFLVNFIIITVK